MIEKPPKINSKALTKAYAVLMNKEYSDRIRAINNKCLYWDKIKYQPSAGRFTPVELWAAVKLSRSLDSKKLQFGKFDFSFMLTDYIQQILHEFDLYAGGNLGTQSLIPEQEKERYMVSSIMEEAIASSQMEGAVTTRKEAKVMLRKEEKPRSKSDQMIVNNYRTINTIMQWKGKPLTAEALLEIHRSISKDTLDNKNDEGRFRETDDVYVVNHIESEIVHTPPHHKEIPILIEQLCDFFNTDRHNYFIHPIIKGIVLHFMIGYIHPFADGNGRTARALFYWYLLSKGYWLTEYLSISRLIIRSKNQYEMAYLHTETDNNDLTYFINYNLKVMDLAYKDLRVYIQRKIDEKKMMSTFLRMGNINHRQAEIIKWFFDNPELLLTVKEAETRFRVTNQTARTDLVQLVQAGFVELISLNKKKQAFVRSKGFEQAVKTNRP